MVTKNTKEIEKVIHTQFNVIDETESNADKQFDRFIENRLLKKEKTLSDEIVFQTIEAIDNKTIKVNGLKTYAWNMELLTIEAVKKHLQEFKEELNKIIEETMNYFNQYECLDDKRIQLGKIEALKEIQLVLNTQMQKHFGGKLC